MTRSAWVTASAPAKINLHLGVGPVRPDGFHPLATVYQAIDLLDEVTVRPAASYEVTMTGDSRLVLDDVPLNGDNIAVRAAVLLAERYGVDEAVAVHIDKRIPVAGGLAGGSADAAAALVACDALWQLGVPREELLVVAAELGSDVPFALVGGTALGTGRGEAVVPAMVLGEYWWVVVESSVGLSTPAVYREFDVLHTDQVVSEPVMPEALMEALRSHDVEKLGLSLRNDLEEAAVALRPELDVVLTGGIAATALGAMLSGSGPSCLFLCSGRQHAAQVSAELAGTGLGPVSLARGPVPGARVERLG
ncbi:MAG: 4-(cytidine 5'-diphospho)-2-C-methyl-D-erythritol kinase [Nocardioides sp.]